MGIVPCGSVFSTGSLKPAVKTWKWFRKCLGKYPARLGYLSTIDFLRDMIDLKFTVAFFHPQVRNTTPSMDTTVKYAKQYLKRN